MSGATFARPREATINISDVFGAIDTQIGAIDIPRPDDFDARITAQVRNTGRFHDGEYSFSDGGSMLGNYGAVLVDDLRQQQQEKARRVIAFYGYDDPDTQVAARTFLAQEEHTAHPDDLILARSLGSAVILIDNSAPRSTEHKDAGRNGATFYVATNSSGLEVYAQAHLLSALDARNRIKSLYRVPEDGTYWPVGEQFRSSVVSDVRRQPAGLLPVERQDWPIPELPDGIHLAYSDKFGNVRVETSNIAITNEVLSRNDRVDLIDTEGNVIVPKIHVVSGLQEIPEHEFGIYGNPAEREAAQGPAYLELVRRVNDCNGIDEHRAYHELGARLGTILGRAIQLSDWRQVTMQIVPSS